MLNLWIANHAVRRYAERVLIVDAEGQWYASSVYSYEREHAANEVAGEADALAFDHVRRIHFLYALVPVPDADPMPIIGVEVEPAN